MKHVVGIILMDYSENPSKYDAAVIGIICVHYNLYAEDKENQLESLIDSITEITPDVLLVDAVRNVKYIDIDSEFIVDIPIAAKTIELAYRSIAEELLEPQTAVDPYDEYGLSRSFTY